MNIAKVTPPQKIAAETCSGTVLGRFSPKGWTKMRRTTVDSLSRSELMGDAIGAAIQDSGHGRC